MPWPSVLGAKFFAARTSLLWGRLLAERRAPGDTHKARELLTEAQTAAASNGYGGMERRAAAALERLNCPSTIAKRLTSPHLHRSERQTVWFQRFVLPLPRKGADHLGRDEVRE